MLKGIKVLTVAVAFLIGGILVGFGIGTLFNSFILGGIMIFFGLGLYAFSQNLVHTIEEEERPKGEDTQTVYRLRW